MTDTAGIGKIPLSKPRTNYLERPVPDPHEALERARQRIRADRKQRAHRVSPSSASDRHRA